MANTIRDYSATAALNTVVDGADISEGCSPAGINDAIRGVMADLKDVSTGAVALESPAADSLTVTGNVGAATFSGDGSALTGIPTPTLTSLGIANHDDITVDGSGNVGIGTTTNNQSGSTKSVTLNAASGMSAYELRNADVFSGYVGNNGTNMYLVNAKNGSLGLYTNNTERMHLTSTGNVGIGAVPSGQRLLVADTSANAVNIQLQNNTASNFFIGADTTNLVFYNGGSERLRIDSSGRVTMPYQPAFSFTGLNNSWANNANFQTLIPASTKINRGNHYNGNTGVFTAPVSGVYFFGFWGLVYTNSGQVLNWRYSLNGGYGSQLVQSSGATGNHTNTSGSVILSLSANDTVTLDAGLNNQTAATPYWNQWNMYGYLMF